MDAISDDEFIDLVEVIFWGIEKGTYKTIKIAIRLILWCSPIK